MQQDTISIILLGDDTITQNPAPVTVHQIYTLISTLAIPPDERVFEAETDDLQRVTAKLKSERTQLIKERKGYKKKGLNLQ
jgi:hypothetical protein